jgi:hypothetical protein
VQSSDKTLLILFLHAPDVEPQRLSLGMAGANHRVVYVRLCRGYEVQVAAAITRALVLA